MQSKDKPIQDLTKMTLISSQSGAKKKNKSNSIETNAPKPTIKLYIKRKHKFRKGKRGRDHKGYQEVHINIRIKRGRVNRIKRGGLGGGRGGRRATSGGDGGIGGVEARKELSSPPNLLVHRRRSVLRRHWWCSCCSTSRSGESQLLTARDPDQQTCSRNAQMWKTLFPEWPCWNALICDIHT